MGTSQVWIWDFDPNFMLCTWYDLYIAVSDALCYIIFFLFSLVLFFFFSPFCVCLEQNHTHALPRVHGLELLVVCHCHANSKTDGRLTPLSGPSLVETEEETVESLVPSLIGSRT